MAYDIFTIIVLIYDIFVSHCAAGVGGWGGRRGLGPRNDVLKTCKSGHLEWWSADNCSVFLKVNILQANRQRK